MSCKLVIAVLTSLPEALCLQGQRRMGSNAKVGNRMFAGGCLLAADSSAELGVSFGGVESCTDGLSDEAVSDAMRRASLHFVSFMHSKHLTGLAQTALENARLAEAEASALRRAVWVSGYARSATSTVLSMITALGLTSPATEAILEPHRGVYAVFEPCHEGDLLSPQLQQKGCGGLLSALARCDFSDIRWLHGFQNPHTSGHDHMDELTPASAGAQCQDADIVAVKTIEYSHLIQDALPTLDANPDMYLIDVVRDPRGILASWKTTPPFDGWLQTVNKTLMADVCGSFAANLQVSHPRVLRVVFERLVALPEQTMRGLYAFLKFPFGGSQLEWLRSTFNSNDCSERVASQGLQSRFSDCHDNSTSVATRWRGLLSDTELASFASNSDCQKVASFYGFEL